MKTIDCIRRDFNFIDDWSERYRYVIDLGEELEEFPETLRTPENKVKGCVSQVWIVTHRGLGKDPVMTFEGTSDSHIVRGLIAIMFILFSNRTASEVLQTPAEEILSELELEKHLTFQRSNGLHSMLKRIRHDAKAAFRE